MGKKVIAFFAVIAIIILCHFYWDKQIAYAMHNLQLPKYPFMMWINKISTLVRFIVFALLIGLGIKALVRPFTRLQQHLFSLSAACAISLYLKDIFKVLCGRYWPDTWYQNNPSLLQNQSYGFHFWKWDYAYASFPSGHSTIVFCAMTYLWIIAPKWRPLAVLVCIAQMVPLITYNYHFLGDIVSGALLGSMCALIAIKYSQSFDKHQKDSIK